jgi:hypothetical protein
MTGLRVVVLGALMPMVLSACGVMGTAPSPIPTPLDRVVKIDQSKVPPGVVAYGSVRGTPAYGTNVEDALKLHTPDDVARMTGAPEDFKAFVRNHIAVDTQDVVASLAREQKTLETEGCDFAVEIRLWGVGPEVATGRERGCDRNSYDVIWAKKDGAWRRVARMQGGWDCAVLDRYRVPADITGSTCWYDTYKTRPYNGPS